MNKLTVFSTILFSICIIISMCSGCSLYSCDNEVDKEIYSPNHLKKAVVFMRDCGATTGFSTHVSVLDENEDLPDTGGNILSSANILHFGPGHDIFWVSDNELVVEYNFKADIRFKSNYVNGVNIIYKDSFRTDANETTDNLKLEKSK